MLNGTTAKERNGTKKVGSQIDQNVKPLSGQKREKPSTTVTQCQHKFEEPAIPTVGGWGGLKQATQSCWNAYLIRQTASEDIGQTSAQNV